jgi:dipeptidase E
LDSLCLGTALYRAARPAEAILKCVPGHIVALGGGGFSGTGAPTPIDRFILSLARRPRPTVCFLGTASGDADTYALQFYRAYAQLDCRPGNLPLFQTPLATDPARVVSGQDVFYVGGGSTANLLAVWRLHGLDRLLREAWENGAVLAGVSAGAICWFEAYLTDSMGRDLAPRQDGLGFLAGSACPHFSQEPGRRPTYQRLIAEGFPGGVALDDGAAVHFSGRELVDVVSERPGAQAYRIFRHDGRLTEEPLQARLLG